MTVKRRAYTLMEILAVIAAIVIIMALSARLFRSLAADVARANRDFQVWVQAQSMFEALKDDVESAVSMDLKRTESASEQAELVLRLPEEQVIYTPGDGKVLRATERSQLEWQLPGLKIQWNPRRDNDTIYAIEITTWMQRTLSGRLQKKYEQSFVYFLKPGSEIYEKQK